MAGFTGEKKEAVGWIDENKTLITEMSDRIWLYAEPSLHEYRSTRLITDELKKAGFDVELGVAGLDTAFVANYGEGSPVFCTYVECDAVPGISQMPVPYKLPVIPGLAGYYDMHHGIGAGTIGAALAVKYVMEKNNISGTFKVFGTPAVDLSEVKPLVGLIPDPGFPAYFILGHIHFAADDNVRSKQTQYFPVDEIAVEPSLKRIRKGLLMVEDFEKAGQPQIFKQNTPCFFGRLRYRPGIALDLKIEDTDGKTGNGGAEYVDNRFTQGNSRQRESNR